MSSILMDIPTLEINDNDLQNLLGFIYKHETLLKEFGAIKIRLNNDCKLALEKREKKFELCPTNEKIVKMTKNESIYLAEKVNNIRKFVGENNFIKDEDSFWSSLSKNNPRPLNISLLQNKSFFCPKLSGSYFHMNCLPNQSILKLGGRKFLNQFVPCASRAHGPGSIFPFSCAEQRLFSLNYHHEGGDHYWYFIPDRERDLLKKLINQQGFSSCLDHGQLFLHPLILDRNRIRYHRIIQHPNEFIVIASGTLSQSFTTDATWSESIEFALPSWIEQVRAKHSRPLCQCNGHLNSLSETIDLNLLTDELTQLYIKSHLNYNDNSSYLQDDNYMSVDIIPTSYSNETNSSYDETALSRNMQVIIPLKRTIPSFEISPTSSKAPSINGYFFEEDKDKFDDNVPSKYQIVKSNDLLDVLNQPTSNKMSIGSIPNERSFTSDTQTAQLYQNRNESSNIDEDFEDNWNEEDCFFSYNDLTDFLSSTVDTARSSHTLDDENTKTSSSTSSSGRSTVVDEQYRPRQRQTSNQTIRNGRILFVSGLNNDVTANDIRSHFIGCIKLIIKKGHVTPHKYAFVFHRTSREAERNIQRPIDYYSLLGRHCRVEYASDCSYLSNNQQPFNKKKISVTKIPLNVDKNDLSHLFPDGNILAYCPARSVHTSSTTTKTNNNNNKVLSGYAFILYDTENQAANVIKHASQYQINGHQLVVSLYRNKEFAN